MIKILFVCHGNICRSPMAEFVMKHKVKNLGMEKDFVINSAATSYEELGNPVHHGTRKKLREVGILCGSHRATVMTQNDYKIYDYIIAMDSNNIRNIMRIIGSDPLNKVKLLLDFANRQGESIADPWYTGNFDATYKDIDEGTQGLINYIYER